MAFTFWDFNNIDPQAVEDAKEQNSQSITIALAEADLEAKMKSRSKAEIRKLQMTRALSVFINSLVIVMGWWVLIMLNTEHFNHGNEFVIAGDTVEAALAQLAWLNDTLAATAAAGHRAYVIGHVPIGLETAYGNDRRVPSSLRPYWMDLFARRYQAIMDSYGEAVVAVQIFGHEHVDTFRLLGDKTVYGNCDPIWTNSRAFPKLRTRPAPAVCCALLRAHADSRGCLGARGDPML